MDELLEDVFENFDATVFFEAFEEELFELVETGSVIIKTDKGLRLLTIKVESNE